MSLEAAALSSWGWRWNPWLLLGLGILLVVLLQFVLGRRLAVVAGGAVVQQRQWQHALTGQALIGLSYLFDVWIPLPVGLLALAGAAAAILGLRCLAADWYFQAFGHILRPAERDPQQVVLPGAFYFLLGVAVTAASFDLTTARYATACLAWADPVAAAVGQHCHHATTTTTTTMSRENSTTSRPNVQFLGLFSSSSSWPGCLACGATAFVVGGLFGLDMVTMVVGAVACTLAELLPYDNFTIPIITAAAVTWCQQQQQQQHHVGWSTLVEAGEL